LFHHESVEYYDLVTKNKIKDTILSDILKRIDQDKKTVYHRLKGSFTCELVRLFQDHPININAQDKEGNTALHYVISESSETAKYLIEAGINMDIQNEVGNTALHEVAKNGTLSNLQLLISKKCDLNVQNKEKDTALHCTLKQDKSINSLIQKNVD